MPPLSSAELQGTLLAQHSKTPFREGRFTEIKMFQAPNLPPFEWVSQHLQVIGWPTLCYAVWRVTRFFTLVEHRVLNAEAHIEKMSTNCFPTMQASLQNQDTLLKSMDGSLKKMVDGEGCLMRTPTPRKRRR